MSIFGKVGRYKYIPTKCCNKQSYEHHAAKQRSPWMNCMNHVNKKDFSKYIPGAGVSTAGLNRGARAALLRRATGSVTVDECTAQGNCTKGQMNTSQCGCRTNL
jgi:hypothetical protein